MKKIIFSSLLVLMFSSFGASASLIQGQIVFTGSVWSHDGTTLTILDETIHSGAGDLAFETSVVLNDLAYNPFVPLAPLWETDNFTFSITTLVIDLEDATHLSLTGFGILADKNGILEDTAGTWDFSGGIVNWSSATVVPVPAAVWLFGTAVLGLVGIRRKGKLEVSAA